MILFIPADNFSSGHILRVILHMPPLTTVSFLITVKNYCQARLTILNNYILYLLYNQYQQPLWTSGICGKGWRHCNIHTISSTCKNGMIQMCPSDVQVYIYMYRYLYLHQNISQAIPYCTQQLSAMFENDYQPRWFTSGIPCQPFLANTTHYVSHY